MWHVWGENRNAYKFFVGQPKGKAPLVKPRCRWMDNIEIYLTEIRWECMDWIHLAQDIHKWRAVVNTVMNHTVPEKMQNFL